MPRVCLTDAQRKEAAERDAIKRMYRLVSDGLAVKMNRDKLTREMAGELVGITRQSVSIILAGNDIRLNIKTLFKLFHALGLEIKPRNQA